MDSTSLAIVLAAFGLLLILLSYRRQVHHRTLSAVGHGVCGAMVFSLGALLFTLALNFNTYERLQTEQPIAQLSFDKTGPRSYRVSLMRIPSGDLQVFNLSGDLWRIEARQLIWTGWPEWFGLHSQIRLENLLSAGAGKDSATAQYSLSRNPGIDLWKVRQQHSGSLFDHLTLRLLHSEDAELTDGLRYHLYLTGDGLQARAINKRAEPSSPVPTTSSPTMPARPPAQSFSSYGKDLSSSAKSSAAEK